MRYKYKYLKIKRKILKMKICQFDLQTLNEQEQRKGRINDGKTYKFIIECYGLINVMTQ